MMRSRFVFVFVFVVVFGFSMFVQAVRSFDQEEVDGAIKSFLSSQKSESENAQSVGSAISDIDGDGKSEIVLLWALLGPTYWSNTLTVFSKTAAGYKPVASLQLEGMAKKLVSVKAGIILVDQDVYAKNDPRCCPSIKKQMKYRWFGKKISEVKK